MLWRRLFCSLFFGLMAVSVSNSRAATGGNSGVNLTWTASQDTNVVGYYVYYGPGSGAYTQRIDVGNTTGANITGLIPGTTNYFVATGYNAQRNESIPSNEATFINPGALFANVDSSSRLHLIFPVAATHVYDLQASTLLTNWVTLTSIFAQSNSLYDFVDTNFGSRGQTFYRLILR